MKKETPHPSPPVIFYIPTDEVATTVKTDKVAYLGDLYHVRIARDTSVAYTLVHLRLT
jgi:hypothetical protein